MAELKIFKMNEYDWVIAESKEQARDWYAKEVGIGTTEVEVYECNLSSVGEDAGFWSEVEGGIDSFFKEPQIGMFKLWHGMFCQWIWFRDIVASWSTTYPEIVATTEM